MYVIVTNYVNWHRENLQSDGENTGNLKIQFEWVPCILSAAESDILLVSLRGSRGTKKRVVVDV